jgi:hypothetical protein
MSHEDQIDDLAKMLEDRINDSGHPHEIVLPAIVVALANAVASIGCPDCRRKTARAMKRMVPDMIKGALAEADKWPSQSQHRH